MKLSFDRTTSKYEDRVVRLRRFRSRSVVLILVLVSVGTTNWLRADTQVFPQGLENVDGSGGSIYPFNTRTEFARIQQIFDASLFEPAPAGFRLLEIAFRANGSPPGGTFDVTYEGVEVRMSTTSRAPESISPTFSMNVGSDEALVFPRTQVRWSTTVVPGQATPFSLVLPLATPYDYFPGRGNLLMDISVYGRVPLTYNVDAHRLETQLGLAFTAVDMPNGDFAPGNGLVTRFAFEAIPEPTTRVLFAIGCAMGCGGLLTRAWKKREER